MHGDRAVTASDPIEAGPNGTEALLARAPTSPFVAHRFGLTTDRLSFRFGRGTIETVARSLQGLGVNWQVLHGVPTGCEHRVVDHLVIGPPGVFTVNVKDHRGSAVAVHGSSLEVDGAARPCLDVSRSEGRRAASLLTRASGFVVPVQPVVVVLADVITVDEEPDGVAVLSPKQVVSWLTGQDDRFDPNQVCAIYGQARRASLWR